MSTLRLTELTRSEKIKLKAEEAYLIAFAIDVEPEEILEKLFVYLKLKKSKDEKG